MDQTTHFSSNHHLQITPTRYGRHTSWNDIRRPNHFSIFFKSGDKTFYCELKSQCKISIFNNAKKLNYAFKCKLWMLALYETGGLAFWINTAFTLSFHQSSRCVNGSQTNKFTNNDDLDHLKAHYYEIIGL